MKLDKNGFQSKVWGPAAWLFLHTIALNYDPSKKGMKEHYRCFFKCLKGVLPCGKCRENYTNIITNVHKLDNQVLKSRDSLCRWLFTVHNQVQADIHSKTLNERNVPKYKKEQYKEAMEFYEQFRANCGKTSYGCVMPKKGAKKKAVIVIKPIGKRKEESIIVKN